MNHTNINQRTEQFAIAGMSCQACALRIEKLLNKKPIIANAAVNFANETLTVSYADTAASDTQAVIEWVSKAGFTATPKLSAPPTKMPKAGALWLLWLLALPFVIGMFGMMLGSHTLMMPAWLQCVLATLVQLSFGLRFYAGAWASAKNGTASMDTLVALGTTAIWLYSCVQLAMGMETVYFEASVMVIAFVRLGKFLEARTKKQSLGSLALLSTLLPEQVVRIIDNKQETVSLKNINKGDTLIVRVGDKIATDGNITEGSVLCDEAHLTGESLPVLKGVGDTVFAGSSVVDGSAQYRVRQLGNDTRLGDMIAALDEAQGVKADIARLADRISAWFVPAVMLIALATFAVSFWWLSLELQEALMRAVSVLVIACPCALGLATPAAIMAGMGLAARHGVWFIDAPSLERAGRIDTLIFDKTGTLTTGKPTVIAFGRLSDDLDEWQILALSCAIERHSTHPLAQAIIDFAATRKADTQNFSLKNIHTVIGKGISAEVDNIGEVRIGTLDFVGVSLDKLSLTKQFLENAHHATLVAVCVNDAPVAIFALTDAPKPYAKTLVQKLQKNGVQIQILSGDRQAAVDDLAAKLDIAVAKGAMTPRDKAAHIQALIASGHSVAMVGDGVNDAPAMAAAQTSFAVGAATDIARAHATAQLLGDSLVRVYDAYQAARLTLKVIHQNLFFAFIYNAIGIVLAVFGLLNPMIAALAMAASSLSVLLNALRLTRIRLVE